MHGPAYGIGDSAGEKSAVNHASSGRQPAGALSGGPTLSGAVVSAEHLHGYLLDTALMAENLATAVGGEDARPAETPANYKSAESLVGVITHRVSVCRDPAERIRTALERIQRAIG